MNRRQLFGGLAAVGAALVLPFRNLYALTSAARPELIPHEPVKGSIPFRPGMTLHIVGPKDPIPHSGQLLVYDAETGKSVSNVLSLDMHLEAFAYITATVRYIESNPDGTRAFDRNGFVKRTCTDQRLVVTHLTCKTE